MTEFKISEGQDASMEVAMNLLRTELNGWWYSVGECSTSCHASVGPDPKGKDADLLSIREFDEGFHADLAQPCRPGDALMEAIEAAIVEKSLVSVKGSTQE